MDDLRWQWWDTVSGVPGEDELHEPTPMMTYTPTSIDADRIKAAIASRAPTSPKPEHWARKLGRRIANAWPK